MLYLVAQNLGLWHVTQRYDRDEYVRVVTENLLPAYQSDLLKLEPSSRLLNTFNLSYDYASLMHFPPKVGPFLYQWVYCFILDGVPAVFQGFTQTWSTSS